MAIDPTIISRGLAQFQQPADPIERYGRVLALQNGIRQGQVQDQQLQAGALDLQQKQQQITGQQLLDQAISQAYTKRPDGSLELNRDAVVQHLTSAGQGHQIPGLLKNFNDLDEAAAKAKKAQLDAKVATDDYAASGLLTIYDSKFDPSVALGTIAHARETGAIAPDQAAQLASAINASPTPETVQGLIQPLLDKSPSFQKLVDSRKTAQAAADSAGARQTTAQTGKTELDLKTPALQAEADQKVRSNLAAKLGAAKTPDEYNAILGEVPLKVAKDFIGKTPDQARRLGMTAEQQTQADLATQRERREAEDSRKRLAFEAQRNARENQQFQLNMQTAKAQGLAGVPAHLIGPASAAYEKAGIEYASATSAADAMQKLLDLADSGNKAAGANVPLVGVETVNAINGIKRINSAEIHQYGTAGSLFDQIQGKLGKLVEGKPIPADVLKDIRELHTELEKQAVTTYQRKVQVTNQAYGSQFKPVEFQREGGAVGALPPQAKSQLKEGTDTTFANGQVWTMVNGKETRVK